MSSVVATIATPEMEGQPNNTRFKVVKIDGQRSTAGKSHPKGAEDGTPHEQLVFPNGQKSITYKRGRWTVTDFYPPVVSATVLPAVSAPAATNTTTATAVPPVTVLLSNPSSTANSTPSTPTLTLTPSLHPLTRLPSGNAPSGTNASAVAAVSVAVTTTATASTSVVDTGADTGPQPMSPPAFEEITAKPVTALTAVSSGNNNATTVTATRPANSAADVPVSVSAASAVVDRAEDPVLPLTSLMTQALSAKPSVPTAALAAAPPASSSVLTDVAVECKDKEPILNQSSILSLPQLTSVLSPDGSIKSQPNSGSSSVTSPSVTDLTSLAKVIRAHPDAVLTAVTSPTREVPLIGREDVAASAAATAAAISAAIASSASSGESGGEMSVTRASTAALMGQSVADPASGYATPASMHSVTGANAASILPPYVSSVAIDNKIEQAMDLVKSHLMFAVREEVDVLKEKIVGLLERIQALETENAILKQSHDIQQSQSIPNNQMTQSEVGNAVTTTAASQPGSPVQPLNPQAPADSSVAQDLANLVSEVAITSPPSGTVAAAVAEEAVTPADTTAAVSQSSDTVLASEKDDMQ